MSRTHRNLAISMDVLRVTLLRARTSHESTQQLLQDTRIHVRKLQQQLCDLQQQLNALHYQHPVTD